MGTEQNQGLRRRDFLAQAVAASAAGIATTARAQSQAPIKLGMVLPMSGRFASYGVSGQPGAAFATRYINARGGVQSLGGRKMELLIADTKGDTKVTVSEIERLINDEKVVGIVGPFSSLDAMSANLLSDQYSVPFISPYWVSAKAFELNSRFARTINITSDTYADSTMKMLGVLRDKHGMKADKIAILYDNSEFGRSVGHNLREQLKRAGNPAVLDLPVTPPVTDFTPFVLRARDSGADVVLAGFYFNEAVLYIRASDALNFRVPVIGFASGFSDFRVPDALGSEIAQRALSIPIFGATTGLGEGSRYTPMQAFMQAFQDEPIRPHHTPGVEMDWYMLGAQAVFTFKLALEAAATTDGAKLNDAITKLSIPAGSEWLILPFYDPALAFAPNGAPKNQQIAFAQWQSGRSILVAPDNLAVAKPRLS